MDARKSNPIFIRLLQHRVNKSKALIDLSRQFLTDKNIEDLNDFLSANKTIKNLKLDGNRISSLGIAKLTSESITVLHMVDNNLKADDIKSLVINFPNLTYLDVSDNKFGDQGVEELVKHPKLTHVVAENCGITSVGGIVIAHNPKIRTLNLRNNNIKGSAKAYSENETLESFDISLNNIDDAEILNLSKNKSICILIANNNDIGDPGAFALCNMPKLNHLDLTMNNVTDRGCKALRSIFSIMKLELETNEMTSEGDGALKESNPFIRMSNGFAVTGQLSMPSLQDISLFAATSKAEPPCILTEKALISKKK